MARIARRPEGVFVNPFERGEIGPDLFHTAEARPRMSEVYAGLGCSAHVRPLRSHYQADHGRKARLRSRERKHALTQSMVRTVALLAAGKAQIVGAKQRHVSGDNS